MSAGVHVPGALPQTYLQIQVSKPRRFGNPHSVPTGWSKMRGECPERASDGLEGVQWQGPDCACIDRLNDE